MPSGLASPRRSRRLHPAAARIFGIGLGGYLLVSSTWVAHREWKQATSEADQALYLRYASQLREIHHVLAEHPESPPWLPILSGYASADEVLGDLERARRGAAEGGFLPEEAETAPDPDHEDHPAFRRHLTLGIAHWTLLLVSLIFAPGALRRLLRPRPPPKRRIMATWQPATVVGLCFWGLLIPATLIPVLLALGQTLAPGLDFSTPALARATDLVSYLLVQGLPVLLVAAVLLPKPRHFVRALGLGTEPLRSASTIGFLLGLFGLDSLLTMAFYELEKLGGSTDTRDFLNAYLIDAPLGGLGCELAVAAVIAPVGEEILFRGFLFNAWRARTGFWPAALASSLIFGGMHFYSWFGMAAIVSFGLLACWIYERSGSLWPPILLHALTNFTITLGTWYAWSEFPPAG